MQAPTPRQTLSRRYIIEPGASLDIRESDLGGFLPQTANANLTLSDKPPIDVRSAVRGLLTYPYGCVEQTTSTAYPHLFIDEEAARKFDLKVYSPAQRAAMLDTSIARLAGMQAPNGGFSLWGNHGEYEYWLSAYVTHFLNDAREQGFAVPAEMEKKALEFLLKGLQEGVATLPRGPLRYNRNSTWSDWRYAGSGRFGVLAYGAYVLALHGRAPLATLRQLAESSEQSHSGLALVHLGLALKLMGDEPRSQASIDAAARGRTTLVIAHRLSTVMNADQILVMDGGRIIERGTHAELIDAAGRYARMWALQQQEDDAYGETAAQLAEDLD